MKLSSITTKTLYCTVSLILFIVQGIIAQDMSNKYNASINKVSDFINVDYSAFYDKPTKPKKDTTSKVDSAYKQIKILLDSIKALNNKKPFDCNNAESTKPLLLRSLNLIDTRAFDVTHSKNIKLSLFGIDGEVGKNDILIQANFFVYKDFPCENSTITRALVGMVLYLRISELKIGASAKSLANISAGVQLRNAKADYHLEIFGLTGSIKFRDLPQIGDLDVEHYAKIMSAWGKIQDALDQTTEVDPVIIPNYKDNIN